MKPIAHHIVGDDGVDLDAVHAVGPEHERRSEVPSTTRADHEGGESGGWGLGTGHFGPGDWGFGDWGLGDLGIWGPGTRDLGTGDLGTGDRRLEVNGDR